MKLRPATYEEEILATWPRCLSGAGKNFRTVEVGNNGRLEKVAKMGVSWFVLLNK